MGLFSSKKKIHVGSSIYNLAGAIEDRVQYLPTVVNTKIIGHTANSIGETIQDSLIRGPGMRLRSYARWARTQGYTDRIGFKTGKLSVGSNIDIDAIAASIPTGPGESVVIQTAEIGIADYGYWVDQWMLENHPTEVTANYEIDFDEQTNVISIIEADVVKYTFSPVNFDDLSEYLYVSYQLVKRNQAAAVVPGVKTEVASIDLLPSIDGYTLVSDVTKDATVDLVDKVTVEITYSDGRPGSTEITDTPHTDSYVIYTRKYEKMEYHGSSADGSSTSATKHIRTHFQTGRTIKTTTTDTQTEDIGGGVIKTTKTTTAAKHAGNRWYYQDDTQEITIASWSPMHVIIYKEGDGNALYDGMFTPDLDMGSFLPPIPLRRWGNFIGEDYQPSLYTWTSKAVKRSMDKKITYLVDQLKDNDSIGDIDFAYLAFGVSLNTKEKSGLKYIYKFFQALASRGAGGDEQYKAWLIAWNAANDIQTVWAAWKTAQAIPTDLLLGTPEPPQAVYPPQPLKQMKYQATAINYNMTLNWSGIAEVVDQPGLGRLGAKVGDLWFVRGAVEEFRELLVTSGNLDDRVLQGGLCTLYWQDKADSYRAMGLTGLHHTNIVYKGKGVDIYGSDALADPEESGFIVPLHEGVMRSMSLKDSTQLSTASQYMVLNYYQVTKQKWYQSSWFKVVLIVAIIVITIVTWGAGATAGAGVLGTAASVGTAVGLAGTAAIIAGAAINAVAGMIIAQLIMQASVALFGPEVGAIIGAVAAVATLSMGTSLASGGTAMAGLQSMTSSLNLLKMTVAGANGFSQATQGKLEEFNKEMVELQADYKAKLSEIYTAWSENLGFNKGTIDIQALTEAAKSDHVYEDMDNFLSRTLWTGSDIAGITNEMVSKFSEASITTQLP